MNLLKKILKFLLTNAKSEHELNYPLEINANSFHRVLLVAPHPDDEVIGAFGFIFHAKNLDLLIVTDGSHGIPGTDRKNTRSIRYAELIRATSKYSIRNIHFLEIEDGHVAENDHNFSKLDLGKYDLILTPNIFDIHSDHYATTYALMKRFIDLHSKSIFGMYEVWGALPIVNRYIDLTPLKDAKSAAINEHYSQVKNIDYSSRILALNSYRGMLVNRELIECYWFLTSDDIKVFFE